MNRTRSADYRVGTPLPRACGILCMSIEYEYPTTYLLISITN